MSSPERSLCNQCVVVDSGTLSASVIVFCCRGLGRPSFQWRRVPLQIAPVRNQNTCEQKMMLRCMELVSCAWLCVGLQCGKSAVCPVWSIFLQAEPNIAHVHDGLIILSQPYNNSLEKGNIRCLEHSEKGAQSKKARSFPATHPPCLGGRCREYPRSMKAGRKHIEYFVQSKEYRHHDLAGHRIHFGWRLQPEPTTTKILQETKKIIAEKKYLFIGVSRKDHLHEHVQ